MRQVDQSLAELAFQADTGDPHAQYCVGLVFLLGESVDQDLDAAYKWMARASAGGHAGAKSLAARLLQVHPTVNHAAPLPNQIPERSPSLWVEFLILTREAFEAIQKRASTLGAKQLSRFASGMQLEPGAKFPDFPPRRTEGFEFTEVS